jgi:pyruvate dehydrogenase E2 component (dihydrolipoamide acetyltransferase)
MPHEIVMPRLGWSTEEGTLIEWLKRDGDSVRTGDIVCVIESDKAQLEVESFETGVLRIPVGSPVAGVKVPVGTLLGYVLAPGETLPAAGSHGAPVPLPAPAMASRSLPRAGGGAARTPTPATRRGGEPTVSPRARRVAAELRVDWTGLRGSGRAGRIVERDVRAASAAPPASVRRLIAERMHASVRATAPVTLTTEADATALVQLRTARQAEAHAGGAMAPS